MFLKLNYPTQTLKDKWIPLENNVTLFSAFYDNRKFRPRPVLVVLGLEKQSDRSTRYKCLVSYRNGRKITLRDSSPLQVLTRVHWAGVDKRGGKILNHRPFSYLCVLPTSEIPECVTIAPDRSHFTKFPHFENHSEKVIDSQKFALVTNRKNIKRTFSFGVCISSPIFKVDDPQQLVDTFEMNRLLGAEFFTVYTYKVSGKPLEILETYSKDHLAEVVTNWGSNFPGEAHYYGQLLSITDCLYRNIYRVKYLVYTDFDEVVVPLRHPSWSALMKDLDGPNKGSFNFEMVYLRGIQGLGTTHEAAVNCPSGVKITLKSSRYATFAKRSVTVGFISRRTKYITKTNVTLIAQIHYAEKLVHGYAKVDVPVLSGLLYHYRVPYSTSRHIKAWVMDGVVKRYLTRLFTAVKNFMCRLS